jgi:hypothetical protein
MTMRALLFSALLLAACASPAPSPAPMPPPPAPLPTPRDLSPFARQVSDDMGRLAIELSAPNIVIAEIGQSADLGNGLTVRPLAIIEDSRCPQNVQCLWAGRMRIRAMVSGIDTELTLGEGYYTSARGIVHFEIASPSAWAEWPREELGPRPAYRFGFRRG